MGRNEIKSVASTHEIVTRQDPKSGKYTLTDYSKRVCGLGRRRERRVHSLPAVTGHALQDLVV